jgi:hypothetical protein
MRSRRGNDEGGKEVQRRLFRSDAIVGWDGWAHVHPGWLVQTVVTDDGGQERVVMERWFLTNVPWGLLSGGQSWRCSSPCMAEGSTEPHTVNASTPT